MAGGEAEDANKFCVKILLQNLWTYAIINSMLHRQNDAMGISGSVRARQNN